MAINGDNPSGINIYVAEYVSMQKEDLLGILRKLLQTDVELDFLGKLEQEDLEKLIACVRDKLDRK